MRIVGNSGIGFTALPVPEIDYRKLSPNLPPIMNYESKWDPTSPFWIDIGCREAKMGEDLYRGLTDHSMMLFERLGF